MDQRTITPGRYPATVTGSALGRTSGGADQLVIGLDVHVTDRETGQQYPVPMTWYGFFTDASLPTTDKALAALGFDPTARDISDLNPDEPHQTPIYGVECEVVIELDRSEEYGDRLRVRWINRAGGGLALKERMEPTEARAFGATLRQRLLAQRGPGAARPAAAPQRPAAAPSGRPAVPPARPPQGPPAAPRQPVQQRTESGPRPTDPPAGTGWTDDIPF